MPPTDVLRDVGALALSIWVLNVAWTPVGTGGRLVYVLLPVICTMASLTLPYLARLLVGANGKPVLTATIGPRLALNAPLALAILVTIIWDAVDSVGDGDGTRALGPGVLAGSFVLAVAAVPRLAELRRAPDRDLIARRWRRLCGWAAGLGLAAIVISSLVTIVQMTQYGELGGLFALLLLIIALEVVFFVALLAVPALRTGANHPAWQPTVLWLAVVFVIVLLVVGGPSSAVESFGEAFYGLWLLTLAGGCCAVPLVGGLDGNAETDAQFWALVVANAFRIIVVAGCLLVAVSLLVVIMTAQQASVPGELIWALIAMIVVTLAAGVGSSRLRVGLLQGRDAALGAVAVMVLITIITVAVSGMGLDQGGGAGNLVGLGLMFGPFGIIVVGLTVPRPVREALAAHRGVPPAPGQAPPPGAVPSSSVPPAGQPAGTFAPMPGPAVWHGSSPVPDPVTPEPHTPAAVEATQRMGPALGAPPAQVPSTDADDDIERTVMRPARSAAAPPPTRTAPPSPAPPAPGPPDPQGTAAADPATPLRELMTIAQTRADLRPSIAENPSTYPDLLAWLGQLGDPAVDAALARRRETAG